MQENTNQRIESHCIKIMQTCLREPGHLTIGDLYRLAHLARVGVIDVFELVTKWVEADKIGMKEFEKLSS